MKHITNNITFSYNYILTLKSYIMNTLLTCKNMVSSILMSKNLNYDITFLGTSYNFRYPCFNPSSRLAAIIRINVDDSYMFLASDVIPCCEMLTTSPSDLSQEIDSLLLLASLFD